MGDERGAGVTCFLCHRDVTDGCYRNVDYGDRLERICDECWQRADIIEYLDMTEGEE